jgi:hypothetical protein
MANAPLIPAVVNFNSSTWTAYTVASICQRITIREVNQAGTTDYMVADPGNTSNFNTQPAGSKFILSKSGSNYWYVGDQPFQVKTVSGSPNFDRTEE